MFQEVAQWLCRVCFHGFLSMKKVITVIFKEVYLILLFYLLFKLTAPTNFHPLSGAHYFT